MPRTHAPAMAGIIERMLVLPFPVTVVRDGWDWLIVWCTVGATAVISIRRADRIAAETRGAAVRERRNVFELGILAKLIEICGLSPPGAANVLAGLLRVLPDQEDLPGIRAESAQGRVPSNEALKPFMAEYFEAVDRRLRDGEASAVPRPQQARFRDRSRFLLCGR